MFGPWSIQIPDQKGTAKGETPVYRSSLFPHTLIDAPNPSIHTIFDLIQCNAKKWKSMLAFGTRKVLEIEIEDTKCTTKMAHRQPQVVEKKWMYWELGPYTYRTYEEVGQEGLELGAGLRKLGLNKGDKIVLYGDTSANWQLMSHAAFGQSMTIVTAYASLGEIGLTTSLEETEAHAIFVDPLILPLLLKPLQTATKCTYVIYHGQPVKKRIEELKTAYPDRTVLSYDELLELGKANPIDPNPPEPSDLACIMYTSGSTGTPKGVLLTHKNVIAAIGGVYHLMGQHFYTLGEQKRMIAYLPTAHIYPFVFELFAQYCGGILGYARMRTLADISVRNCKGDLREFKPEIFPTIPAVWELLRKGVETKIAQSSIFVRTLFWVGMWLKTLMKMFLIPGTCIIDRFILHPVQEALGGEVIWGIYGGAALSEKTQEFICTAFAEVGGGYGMTETCAMGSLSTPEMWRVGTCGPLVPCIEAKLVDVPELGYFTDNYPPQGEIYVRGPSVTSGYLNREDETAALFDNNGWLKTGDVGEFGSLGDLKIIDRVKNMVKTRNGEYIALEKLEKVYGSCNLVMSICIYAAPDYDKPIAIVSPLERALIQFATFVTGVETDGPLEMLVDNPAIVNAVSDELKTVGRSAGLSPIEIIEGAILVSDEWTPENGMLTPARKLNRRKIVAKYHHEIEHLYGNSKGRT